MKIFFSFFLFVFISLVSQGQGGLDISEVQNPQVNKKWTKDEDRKITDRIIRSDLENVKALKERFSKLHLDSSHYAYAKAWAYLTVASEEYYDHDRSGVVSEFRSLGLSLLKRIEEKTMIDPVIEGGVRIGKMKLIRQDLWDKLRDLKFKNGFRCAEKSVAQGEVTLQWAGNEYLDRGFDGARKEIALAEELTRRAIEQEAMCGKACKPPGGVVFNCRNFQALISFKHNKAVLEKKGMTLLDTITGYIKKYQKYCGIKKICIEGHASLQSRLPPQKAKERNEELSKGRSKSVESYLKKQEIKLLMEAYGCGDRYAHDKRKATLFDFQELFDKDRRVEFKFLQDTKTDCGCGKYR